MEAAMASGSKSRVLGVCLGIGIVLWAVSWTTNAAIAQTIVVDAAPSHVANTFSPFRSLGAAIDRLRTGTPDHLLTDPVLKEILGAGWQTVTYRQNTELMVEAWHWNPHGAWSDAEKQQGYFVGSAEPTAEMIRHSWASPLPHRGFSQGDGNGWSRLTDGDPKSYWKSNPYLTKAFTGEDDSLHPQWVMIDLGSKVDSQCHSDCVGRALRAGTTQCSSGPANWSPSMTGPPRARGKLFPWAPSRKVRVAWSR